MPLLTINNLHARTGETPILKGVSFAVERGEAVALMGPNGSGKSTLASVLMGHPSYEVTEGTATYDGEDLLTLKPEERAKRGLFLAFQYPHSVAGVTLSHFLRLAYNATHIPTLSVKDFLKLLKAKMDVLQLPHEFMQRSLNEGFSGGEKKRAEMLQLLVLQPRLAILDETDSGLDVDALRIVGEAVQKVRTEQPEMSLMIITHYQRLLQYVPVDRVVVMQRGVVTKEGTPAMLTEIETSGYQGLSTAAPTGAKAD